MGHDEVKDDNERRTVSGSVSATRVRPCFSMRQCFEAVTTRPAEILYLDGYGLEPGCHTDFVLLQAQNPIEAIRLRRATRLAVYRCKNVWHKRRHQPQRYFWKDAPGRRR